MRACGAPVESKILSRLNIGTPLANRYSRVIRPMPPQYYEMAMASHTKDGEIAFEIIHVNRMVKDPKGQKKVVATGRYESKTAELFLIDKKTGKAILPEKHELLTTRIIIEKVEKPMRP